ncbi:MAG TPA: DUF885 domain-containing protein [Vicinamibacteria bacterium]|nr:DUF885 domain-containing protein [Vicinamibacteria bacterium]
MTFAILSLLLAAASPDSARLHALLEEIWQESLRESPLSASEAGDRRYDDRMPSVGPADRERRRAARQAFLTRLEAIPRPGLEAEDQVSLEMALLALRNDAADDRYGLHRLPLQAEAGFHSMLTRLPATTPLRTVSDYEKYITRLRGFRPYFDQQIENMREGMRTGFTQPRAVLDGFDTTIAPHAVDDVEKSAFFAPFRALPDTIPAAEQERLRAQGRAAVAESVLPAFRTLLSFFRGEYLPGARATTGAADLPEGRGLYAYLVRRHTTLDVTPEEVHRVGLGEVERIRREMEEVIRAVGFQGDFAAFLKFLRTDPRFYAKTPEALLKEASAIAKRMDGKLPGLFATLPRLPYGVEPVPPDIAPRYTSGRYVPGAADGTRAGTYWVNTHALESRPLYNLEALTLHEAVPGHHLQVARSQELTHLPAFRRHEYVTAFGEGWGLYSERLGLEAGFYKDPYSNFGRLTYEMWRACRLVVDTGLHALGWSREKARDYLASNTALPLHEVQTEIDRYISWPGQALAYKMGELKIRALRAEAEKELGASFDVRAFHDVVLGSGSVPLSVLERTVRAWIGARRAAAGRPGS